MGLTVGKDPVTGEDYDDENFSEADMRTSWVLEEPEYLVTPRRTMKKFRPFEHRADPPGTGIILDPPIGDESELQSIINTTCLRR